MMLVLFCRCCGFCFAVVSSFRERADVGIASLRYVANVRCHQFFCWLVGCFAFFAAAVVVIMRAAAEACFSFRGRIVKRNCRVLFQIIRTEIDIFTEETYCRIVAAFISGCYCMHTS